MQYLKLRLKAPLQSYGVKEDWYNRRRTASQPTKSSIVGMICCAMGIWSEETDQIKAVSDSILSFRVHSNKPVHRMTDEETVYIGDYLDAGLTTGFRTADGKVKKVKNSPVRSQQIYKDYLCDADFVVELSGNEDFIKAVKEALLHPIYPYYLGRYCCTPELCVVVPD